MNELDDVLIEKRLRLFDPPINIWLHKMEISISRETGGVKIEIKLADYEKVLYTEKIEIPIMDSLRQYEIDDINTFIGEKP